MPMKKIKKSVIPKFCFSVGAILLLISTLILIFWQFNINSSIKNNKNHLKTLQDIMPTVQGAVPQERRDNTMPTLNADKTDFVGILEMPQYKSTLPVCAKWGKISKYPCQLNGSVYNRTMQVGATNQKGQCDFYQNISVGDTVFFTDMEGNRYSYTVTNLSYEKHADQTTLMAYDSDFTLFIKNIFDFEYLIVYCTVAN